MKLQNAHRFAALFLALTVSVSFASRTAVAAEFTSFSDTSAAIQTEERVQMIPVLGTIWNADSEKVGIVTDLLITLTTRTDNLGLRVVFATPENFLADSQDAVRTAISRAAIAAGLSPASWTIVIDTPHPEVTFDGPSYSAMTALTVIALAKGDTVHVDRVLTGTVTADGVIGDVGGLELKIAAALTNGLRHIVVPETIMGSVQMPETPFLLAVSSVTSLAEAYTALTDREIL